MSKLKTVLENLIAMSGFEKLVLFSGACVLYVVVVVSLNLFKIIVAFLPFVLIVLVGYVLWRKYVRKD